MSGLDSIAMAVAHLEQVEKRKEKTEDKTVIPPETHRSPPAHTNFGGATRMVSSDNSNTDGNQGVVPQRQIPEIHYTSIAQQSAGEVCFVPTQAQNAIYPYCVVKPMEVKETPKKKSWGSSAPIIPKNIKPDHQKKNPVASLLVRVSVVTSNLDQFFRLMHELERVAAAGGEKPPEIPKTDEVVEAIERNDVLLGRGGETNHHLGNIQYRQLVKACQPAYLAAKRRDKPRIAKAIVQVIRCRGGRFLKKQATDSSWRDVGNQRAREKTSQALREGAPELRSTIQSGNKSPAQGPTRGRPNPILQQQPSNPHAMAMGPNGHNYYHVPPIFQYSPDGFHRQPHAQHSSAAPMTSVASVVPAEYASAQKNIWEMQQQQTQGHQENSQKTTTTTMPKVPAAISGEDSEEDRAHNHQKANSPSLSVVSKGSETKEGTDATNKQAKM